MDRTLLLALNRFTSIPISLRATPSQNIPKTELSISLAHLYHHYYLDSYDDSPPDPDPAQFEYLRFLAKTPDFRLRGDGIGVSTLAKRHSSAALGQAFCRWFLHDYMNITYFAHIERILGRPLPSAFGKLRLERVMPGDVPDYLCAANARSVYLAEAKGRNTPISFASKEFAGWREQFSRVAVKNPDGTTLSMKGFIVGTRLATEAHSSAVRSKISAEDPRTPGDLPFENEESRIELGVQILVRHYGNIAAKLGQPILAAALTQSFLTPEEIRFPAIVWEFLTEPLAGQRFVGGYFGPPGATPHFVEYENRRGKRLRVESGPPMKLGSARLTFFGVAESVFRHVTQIARVGLSTAMNMPTYDFTHPFYSAISVLRDGSIVAPIEFLAAIGPEVY